MTLASGAYAVSERATSPELRWAARTLARHAGERRPIVLTLPAPVVDPLAMPPLEAAREATVWLPPRGPAVVTAGSLRELSARGHDRFSDLRRGAEALFRELAHDRHPAAPAHAPRLFGGLAFAPGAADTHSWTGFGDALFTLPRWTYAVTDDAASLSVAVDGRELSVEGRLRLLRAIEDHLEAFREERCAAAPRPRVASTVHVDRQAFRQAVRRILAAVAAGEVQKVVTARRSVVTLDGAADPLAILSGLRARFPGCTTFAFRRAGADFLGATPEHLVTKREGRVWSEALAGSTPAGRPAAREGLLTSRKDRVEHGLVAEAVASGLSPFCLRLERQPTGIRALPHVLHLCTPIVGWLREAVHVLDVAAALHPTPAVAGVPRERALAWIAADEPSPRGWYAAPVGWFDGTGDGELVVALRSGLLRGSMAHLYAGAGIVEGSDPDDEYDETSVKLRALLEALGVNP